MCILVLDIIRNDVNSTLTLIFIYVCIFSLKYDGKDVPGEVCTLDINPANQKEVYLQIVSFSESNCIYCNILSAFDWLPTELLGTVGFSVMEANKVFWSIQR